jgi:putative spermidine/putrescine transport system permease protein
MSRPDRAGGAAVTDRPDEGDVELEGVAVAPRKRWAGTSWSAYLLVLPLVLFAAVVFVYPILYMAVTTLVETDDGGLSVAAEPFQRVFEDEFARQMVWRTIRVAFFTTLLTLVLAYPVTLGMKQMTPRWRGFMVAVLLSPLLMSIVVRTLGWVVALGSGGLLHQFFDLLGIPKPDFLYTETAIVFGLSHVLLGFMVLALMTSVLKIPDSVVAAAANLGAKQWQILWRIVLPMTRPGVVAGAAIVFPLSASAYVTPVLLGGSRNPVMGSEVYQQAIVQLEFDRASALALVLFLIVLIAVALLGLATRDRKGA